MFFPIWILYGKKTSMPIGAAGCIDCKEERGTQLCVALHGSFFILLFDRCIVLIGFETIFS